MKKGVKYKDTWLMPNSQALELYELMNKTVGEEQKLATKKFKLHMDKVNAEAKARGEFR